LDPGWLRPVTVRTRTSVVVVEATGLSKSRASQARAEKFTLHVVAWRASRSWSERRGRQGTLDDREVAHMAEYPRLVAVPTSPHQRLGEALAQTQKAYDEAMAPVQKAYDEAKGVAGQAYDNAMTPVQKAYDEAKAAAGKAYDEAMAPVQKAYDEARSAAGKAYDEAVAPGPQGLP